MAAGPAGGSPDPEQSGRTIAALPPKRVILTVQARGGLGRTRAFEQLPIRLGRAADNDLVLADEPAVAEHHAELRLDGAVVHVRDLGSHRGTFLNDARVDAQLVASGDVLRLGAAGPTIKVILITAELALEAALAAADAPPGPAPAGQPTIAMAPAAMPPPPGQRLVAVEHLAGQQAGSRRELWAGRVRIGRADENDVVVIDPDALVSRNHAELTVEDGGLWVTDLGSANGTFVGGVRVTRATLRSGDVVELAQNGPRLRVTLPQRATVFVGAGPATPPLAPTTAVVLPDGALPPTFPGNVQAPEIYPPTMPLRLNASVPGLAAGAPPPFALAVLAQLQRDAQDLAELYRGVIERLVADNPLAQRGAGLDAALAQLRGLAPAPATGLAWQALTAADVTFVLPELVAHELRVEGAARSFLTIPGAVLGRLVPDWRHRLGGVPDLVEVASAASMRLLDALRAGRAEVPALQQRHAAVRALLGAGAPGDAVQGALGALRDALRHAADAMVAAATPVLQQAAAEYAAHGAALAAALTPLAAAGIDLGALQAAIRAEYRCADPAQAAVLGAALAALRARGLAPPSEHNLRAIAGLG
ncbi:MAG TPA: FHA domain-containing protein [Polyangia bacterium]